MSPTALEDRSCRPAPTETGELTRLLRDWEAGCPEISPELAERLYPELKRLAVSALRRERPGHTLQPTELVHEAYLRLIPQRGARWKNRVHFFAIAARMIRRILVDHARRRNAARRGAGAQVLPLDAVVAVSREHDLDLVALDDALAALERLDARQSRIVELRFFAGLTVEETAAALRVSPATVKADWAMARAWLYQQLATEPGDAAGALATTP